ncbi:hypothetical protein LIER_06358 [Lithospermum erythrorhizon]|uniref:Uncharacterized protein n=1 Tax=Lithospermum erythrorhizon TaxID=34254 RepID=A0AAV3P4W2_LITER
MCVLKKFKKVQELQGENNRLKTTLDVDRLKTTLDVVQKEKREAQEQCLKEAEKLKLLSSRHTRLEAENVGLTNKLKNAQMMADFSKRKAEDTAQKLKVAEKVLPGQIDEAIRDYHFTDGFRREAGKDAAYCSCRFSRTYKEGNPAIVDNYREFIQNYDEQWFANCNLSAPLTSKEENEENPLPEADGQADALAP